MTRIPDPGRILSGVTVSDLSAVDIEAGDCFLISEPCLSVKRPVNWYSKRIDFGQLSAKVMRDVSAAWNFKSMAWEDRDDYARWDHTHSCYNKVTGVSCYYAGEDGTVSLGTITVGNTAYSLAMPAPVIKQESPVVGQLRFMSVPAGAVPDVIDWRAASFDGWVWPDGSEYPLSAFAVDGEFETEGEVFKVPVISDFIRLNSRPDVSACVEQDYSEFMPQHRHTADIVLSGKVNGKFKYRSTEYGAGHGSHGASEKDKTKSYTVGFDCTGLKPTSSGHILSCSESGTETYPSYTGVQTMVYIGKPVSEVS